MQVETEAQVRFRVLSFSVKIYDLALISCAGNDLVKGIVLRVVTIFRVNT
jgi:hypothetical protein